MNDLGLLDFSHYNAMQDNARKTEALSETLKKSTWFNLINSKWFNLIQYIWAGLGDFTRWNQGFNMNYCNWFERAKTRI